MNRLCAVAVLACMTVLTKPAAAQQLDLTHGGPIDITASDGIEWRQVEQEVIARGDARAVRGQVTVTADRLTAWYRKKGNTGPAAAQSTPVAGLVGDPSTEGNEIYRIQADGHVHVFTPTDQAQGDKATYDLDQSVLVMTGRDLKLTTPNNTITAKDDLEYWPQKHMAVARGDATVTTSDAKRIAADTLVAYTTDNPTPATATAKPPGATPASASPAADPLSASGKLQRVEAFGNVSIRTPTDTVTGDRGVYVPESGMARLGGNVRITRGQNQLNGAEADVNMKTGIANLVGSSGVGHSGAGHNSADGQQSGRVHGLVVPNDESSKSLGTDAAGTGSSVTDGRAKKPAASGQKP